MFALHGRYPLDTPALIKQASEYFDRNWREFFPENRREYAVNVQNAAAKAGVDTGEMIQKYASVEFSPDLGELIERRKRLVPEAIVPLEKVASFIGETTVEEFAEVLHDLDRKFGLESAYHKGGIGDYMHDVLAAPEPEMTKEATWQYEIGRKTYTQKDLARALSHPAIISQYGEANVKEFKNPSVFDSLPTEDKEIILEHSL